MDIRISRFMNSASERPTFDVMVSRGVICLSESTSSCGWSHDMFPPAGESLEITSSDNKVLAEESASFVEEEVSIFSTSDFFSRFFFSSSAATANKMNTSHTRARYSCDSCPSTSFPKTEANCFRQASLVSS